MFMGEEHLPLVTNLYEVFAPLPALRGFIAMGKLLLTEVGAATKRKQYKRAQIFHQSFKLLLFL
jgi:hypothetical protein